MFRPGKRSRGGGGGGFTSSKSTRPLTLFRPPPPQKVVVIISTGYSVQPPSSLSASFPFTSCYVFLFVCLFRFCFWRQAPVTQASLPWKSQSLLLPLEIHTGVWCHNAARMALQDESPDPVALVPLLVEGTERKLNGPDALCLMALGSQLVGGILHWSVALPYKPSARIQWSHLQEGGREGT